MIIPKCHVANAQELLPEERAEFTIATSKVTTMFKNPFNSEHPIFWEKKRSRMRIPTPTDKARTRAKIYIFSKNFEVYPPTLNDKELNEEVAFFRP